MGRAKRSKTNIKDKFLIFTNGKTEAIYFDILKKDSMYDVKIFKHNASPIDLVKKAIKCKSETNKIW